jgi:hypothetical protein
MRDPWPSETTLPAAIPASSSFILNSDFCIRRFSHENGKFLSSSLPLFQFLLVLDVRYLTTTDYAGMKTQEIYVAQRAQPGFQQG